MSKLYKFEDLVIGKDGLLRGPFGSDLKKSLYVPKGPGCYKVFIQDNIFQEDNEIGDYYISKEYFDEKMYRYEVRENDFIVTCDGTLGEIYQLKGLKEKAIISSSLLRITLNTKLVDEKYFYYLFKTILKDKLITKGNNSVLKHLPGINIIKKLEICLPDLDEQKKIGRFLRNIDEKIKNNNKINIELNNYCESLYNYYFFNKDSGTKKYNELLNFNINENWKVVKIKELLDKVPKTVGCKKTDYLKYGEFPVVDQSEKFICGFVNNDKDVLNIKDCIVFGDHTKKIKYINFPFVRGADGTQIIISRLENLTNYLLYLQIKKIDLPNQGYSRYYKFLKEKYVFVPDTETINSFSNSIKESLEKIKTNIKENIELERYLNDMCPLLISGCIKIK